MARYIDIEGFEKLFDEEYKATRKLIYEGETHLDNIAEGFSEAAKVIRAIPTADVVEVRHGYWYFTEYEWFTCSECGGDYENFSNSTNETKKLLAEGGYFPFCPHCGAKMDGERRENDNT